MNVYISKKFNDFFIEKIKEITTIDDYILDGERLDKQKIKIKTNTRTTDVISELLDILPEDSMIVDQSEYPGENYILCVGEIERSQISELLNKDIIFSIITLKKETVRFNIWVNFSQIESIFNELKIINFSSINGKIREKTFFVIEFKKEYVNEFHKIVSMFSNDFIIKDNNFYVKLLLNDFSSIYKEMEGKYEKIEIIDEKVF